MATQIRGTDVEVAVVGRGMIGAAAARHLADCKTSTVLIGPDEPVDRLASQGPFSSHPDQGRITRVAARSPIWAEIALRSINRYREIEQRSGIDFYNPCGLAMGGIDAEGWVARGQAQGSDSAMVDHDDLFERTGIRMPAGLPAMTEGPPAGYINPRRMVEAQTVAAQRAGATIIRSAATNIEKTPAGYRLSGEWGTSVAEKVLLSTGSFGAEFLPDLLDAERRPRTVVRAEITGGVDTAKIPSLIVDDGLADERLVGIYWVPPVMYPDGIMRLKIGGQLKDAPVLEPEDLTDWFHTDGSATESEALEATLRELLPDASFANIISSPCVLMVTPSAHPYVGWVDEDDPTFAMALAGNGSAAKSSDELGRLGASLIATGTWNDPVLNATDFTPQYR